MALKRFRTLELQKSSFPLLVLMNPKRNQATSLLRIIPGMIISTPHQALEGAAFYKTPASQPRRASLGVSSISTWMAALENS